MSKFLVEIRPRADSIGLYAKNSIGFADSRQSVS